jgi:hypothetical protein
MFTKDIKYLDTFYTPPRKLAEKYQNKKNKFKVEKKDYIHDRIFFI